jgi:spore germination cell wall hydrolase CwlJ-like protein
MDILGITIWREARGEGIDGMRAVYHVIVNRAFSGQLWPHDREQVCLQPFQFSCWNSRDPQRGKYPAPDDPSYKGAVEAILLAGEDPTGGATAYYDVSIPAPSWATAQNFTCQIGRLRFHKV